MQRKKNKKGNIGRPSNRTWGLFRSSVLAARRYIALFPSEDLNICVEIATAGRLAPVKYDYSSQ
jgi:hypothetical protein